jgi:hypothetical protein
MLPLEVAGRIKGDAVNPGCKARFSFVSVKGLSRAGELFPARDHDCLSPGA